LQQRVSYSAPDNKELSACRFVHQCANRRKARLVEQLTKCGGAVGRHVRNGTLNGCMDLLILVRNVALATLPGLFWFWWYVRQDRAHPEPRRYLWRVFLLGALVTVPALFLEFTISLFFPYTASGLNPATIAGALLIVAPVEELAKFVVVWAGVYRSRIFNERLDGVIYAVVAALGFATVENVLVVISSGASILPLRLVTATLLHALASGIAGYFMGLAKFSGDARKARRLIAQGLAIAIVLHGLYDFIAISDSDIKVVLLLVLMLLMFLVLDSSVRHLKADDAADRAINPR
jgi:RsiW-degrading membrane proteinase PrsW (M82 family)